MTWRTASASRTTSWPRICARAGGRGQEGGQDAQGGRLARAVRADEPEQVAFVDGEVQAIQRGDIAVHARQALGLNGGRRCDITHGLGSFPRAKSGVALRPSLRER